MSWHVVLFNSKQKIQSIADLDENQLIPEDFCAILESSFAKLNKEGNYREIVGPDYTIDFFLSDQLSSNIMLSLYGENAIFELVKLAKAHGWQIYDSGKGDMINLDAPFDNGYNRHKSYIKQILNKQ